MEQICIDVIQKIANDSPNMVASDIVIISANILKKNPLCLLKDIGGFTGMAKILSNRKIA